MNLAPGTRVRNLLLSEKLGEGGMGEVWKATLELVDKPLAVKFILPERRNPRMEQRFLQEARTMARLNHDRIVPLNDFFVIDDVFVLVMPYLDGVPLSHLIDGAPNGLPLGEVRNISVQVLAGLDYAHDSGIIHRDIKPSNVLITSGGKAWLMDFGIAKAVGEHKLTQTGSVVGTVCYMSPEQILRPDTVDRRADIYSFGIMLFEMLTGRLPFDDPGDDSGSVFRIQSAHCSQPPPAPRQLNPVIPEALEAVVLRALAKQPEDRYQTCAEFAWAIDNYAQTAAPPPTIEEPAPAMPRSRSRRAFLVPALAILLLAAGAGGVYWRLQLHQPGKVSPEMVSPKQTQTISKNTQPAPSETHLPQRKQVGDENQPPKKTPPVPSTEAPASVPTPHTETKPASPVMPQDSAGLSGIWRGHLIRNLIDDDEDSAFVLNATFDGARFSGMSQEYKGGFLQMQCRVNGTLNGNAVRFTKTIELPSGEVQDHAEFEGTLDRATNKMEGSWQGMRSAHGTFVLQLSAARVRAK